jgi:hypothetical protein
MGQAARNRQPFFGTQVTFKGLKGLVRPLKGLGEALEKPYKATLALKVPFGS